jgi:hypothetical protein
MGWLHSEDERNDCHSEHAHSYRDRCPVRCETPQNARSRCMQSTTDLDRQQINRLS